MAGLVLLLSTLQLTLHVLLVIKCLTFVTAKGDADDTSLVSCTLTYKSWIEPDRISITWQLPNTQPNASDASVLWYSDLNKGQCSMSTLTFCMCRYGDANCMDFDTNFEIQVTENGRTYSMPIEPDTCRKPPILDSLSVLPVNSTCLNITWFYEKTGTTFCSDFDAKVYEITYRAKLEHESKIILLDNVHSCNGSHLLSGLVPFTHYEVSVRCKFTDYLSQAIGHWSVPAENASMTLQSVPDGAPGVIYRGFSHIHESCDKDIRLVRVYWQPVDFQKRNGIITSYHINVFSKQGISKVLQRELRQPGEAIHVDLKLSCTLKYVLQLAAATTVGVSSVVAEMDIPQRNSDDSVDVVEVIPFVTRPRLITVTWKLREHTSDKVNRIVVFWCLRSLTGECKESFEWRIVPSNSSSVTVSSIQSLHNYVVGASAGSHGIMWTTCQFPKDEDPRRPVGVRVVAIAADRALSITWDNSPCESRPFGPYIDHFVISACPVLTKGDSNCTGNGATIEVDHDSWSYLLRDLDPDILYKINIVAIGRDRNASPPSVNVYGTVTDQKGIKDTTKIIIFLSILIVVVVGTILVVKLVRRKLGQRREDFKRSISVPPIEHLIPDDTTRLNGYQMSMV